MKKLLLLQVFSILSFAVFSQTFEFSYGSHNTILNYNDTLIVEDSASVSEISCAVYVKNISNASIDVYCAKEYISVVPGTDNFYCWGGSCLPPTTMATTTFTTIDAGVVNSEFTAHYNPHNNGGVSLIKYTFSVFHGASASFYVKYVGLVGVHDNFMVNSISMPYPNPAKQMANIDYSIPSGTKAILQLYNICGKIEKQYALTSNSGSLDINVSDLPSGIYLCSLNVNGRIVRTNRLIVSR